VGEWALLEPADPVSRIYVGPQEHAVGRGRSRCGERCRLPARPREPVHRRHRAHPHGSARPVDELPEAVGRRYGRLLGSERRVVMNGWLSAAR
jgi:hypothetical protein